MARLNALENGGESLRDAAASLLRSYSQVLFSSSQLVGAIFVAATLLAPRTMAGGLLGVAVGIATSRLLSFSMETGRQGLFGYNSALIGLAIGAAFPSAWSTWILVAGAAATTVFVTAAFRSVMSIAELPPLSAPFLVVILAILLAAPQLGLQYSYAAFELGNTFWGLPVVLSDFLVSLGSIFFVPEPLAGAIVLAGLVVYSRIAALLAVVGYAVALAVGAVVAGVIPPEAQLFLTITMIVTALALGGIWFVPGLASFTLVVGSGIVASVFAIATYVLFAEIGYPVLFLPLNATIWVMLAAMRQRTRDYAPKSVDFVPGSPEENLSYYRTHVARFGAHYLARFRAPFLGEWVCTQGPDGEVTHRGHWRHALDFEVEGRDGETFEGVGDQRSDYHCYGLPVLAPSDGTVVHAEGSVPDNEIGEVNLKNNWGNYVVLYHGPGVYSMVAHLKPETIQVVEGQTVRRGDELAKCGNSGRSPVPHLHFQLQSIGAVGAPTIVTELHDVVRHRNEGEFMVGTTVPNKGDGLRNVSPDDDLAGMFAFETPTLIFEHAGGERERLDVEVDLANRRLLASDRGARLFYSNDGLLFTVYDVVGRSGSGLHLLRLALGRVPLEENLSLEWSDHVPLSYVLPAPLRWGLDLVSPFLPNSGLRVDYRLTRDGNTLIVEGTSERQFRGEPLLATRAELRPRVGIRRVEVEIRGKKRTMTRRPDEERDYDQPPTTPDRAHPN